jgi:UDP-N-acetylglucosamine 2-epimerase (non-hydrolysing)
MHKVVTIVGTRPEIIKLSRVLSELEKHTRHVLVHTGQNFDFELRDVFFREMRLPEPKYSLDCPGRNVAETIANVISRTDEVMEEEEPDAVLVYGDTNSCLSVIPAKRRHIPVFHMEAGNRCFDSRVPEEINRKIVDHLSDINMTITEHGRRYLMAEGIRPETVFRVGSSLPEVFQYYRHEIETSRILERLGLLQSQYLVISAHREENIDDARNLSLLIEALNGVAEVYGKRMVFSTHPRTMNAIRARNLAIDSRVEIVKPFGFFDYITLQSNAFCVVSDSGTLMEEASLLGFPAVMIRQAHERPEGMDAGTLIMSGLHRQSVIEAIGVVTSQSGARARGIQPVQDYSGGTVSTKVLRIILSYIEYVNRTTWFKT